MKSSRGSDQLHTPVLYPAAAAAMYKLRTERTPPFTPHQCQNYKLDVSKVLTVFVGEFSCFLVPPTPKVINFKRSGGGVV